MTTFWPICPSDNRKSLTSARLSIDKFMLITNLTAKKVCHLAMPREFWNIFAEKTGKVTLYEHTGT